MVAAVPAFWDSSALAPLCMREPATQRARGFLRQHSLVVWWAARVEVYSAIARSLRTGFIDPGEAQTSIAALDKIQVAWSEIQPEKNLRDQACDLLDRYPLRAADALQLAAALTWCDNHSSGRVFLCADKRLATVAETAGFSVILL